MNREDLSMPDESAAIAAKAQETYVGAVRDWAINGAASKHAFSPDEARAHLDLPGDDVALANANFRLGCYLHAAGKTAENLAIQERSNFYRVALDDGCI